MAKDYIGYEDLAEQALRGVVREALKHAEHRGLVGNHHFYITFKTQDSGVEVPDFLKERYPDEMTIVLQNQFWDLKAGEEAFEVTLTFQKLPATLVVPYTAVTAFADPGVQFGLQFRNATAVQGTDAASPAGELIDAETQTREPEPETEHEGGPQVVSLDKFRKK